MSHELSKQLRESTKQCRALDRTELLNAAANELDRLDSENKKLITQKQELQNLLEQLRKDVLAQWSLDVANMCAKLDAGKEPDKIPKLPESVTSDFLFGNMTQPGQ